MGPVWIEMQAIQARMHRGASLDRQLVSPGYLGHGASLGWTIYGADVIFCILVSYMEVSFTVLPDT